MGKRKLCAEEKEAPLLTDALICPAAKDDTVSKESLSHAPLSRYPRHYGRVYSRRKPTNKKTISISPSNVTKQDDKLYNLKDDSQSNLPSEHHTEKLKKTFCGPERSRSSSLPAKVVYKNPAKMVCGLCQNPLKRKPLILENSVALDDLSVVAVLVCGHVYHADCLEPRTNVEDQSDPLCPLCVENLYP